MVVRGLQDTFYAGNRRTFNFTIQEDDVAKDITGMTITFTIGTKSVAEVTKTTASATEVDITDGPNGLVSAYIVEADTTDLSGDYLFQLELDDAGSKSVVAEGTLTILPNMPG